jgi:hypothetical protein
MYQSVELVLKSYMPKQLEVGMWFLNRENELWILDKVPSEPIEQFVVINGAPVEPYLIYDEQVIATPDEIGWWDDGPEFDDLRDLQVDDVNFLNDEFGGFVDIEIDEERHYEGELVPILYDGKVVICFPGTYVEYDEEDDDSENYIKD